MRKTHFWALLVLFTTGIVTAGLTQQPDHNVPVKHGAQVIHLLKQDVSPRLRDIPPILSRGTAKRVVPNKPIPLPQRNPNAPVAGELVPGLQMNPGTGLNIPSTTKNWE